ncbi:apses-domain-containing protein [Viridothelium virens]|uniref:Apses-domain-containing protein n=1 Tax=Viridothelium virens TaxID=1048519 RepID=A0A6A6HED1_VIRVR|nr:apses-domain-containing protein [Viridothelium virens]
MNHPQPSYMDVHQQPHMSTQAHPVSSAPPTTLPHYSQYGQQPPLLQPGPGSYSGQSSYSHYGYNGVSQPQSAGHPGTASMGSQLMPQPPISLPAMSTTAPGPPGSAGLQSAQGYSPQTFDTTGQVAPPGMKPRVTATLWEDEGSLCFQVEAEGVCVARREDNHMINGTKLLNVAGMTRGRRDGILKSEKTRHVVKIGPMHLKGVWIPFERALDFANKEKITEKLYPLFVHDIGALLYHPSNQPRGVANVAMAAAERRRNEQQQQQQQYMRNPQGPQPPSLTHHHSMSNPIGANIPQPPHSIAPHPASGRPGLDRAHTFPTPPTSASSIMGMGNSGSSYEWGGAPVSAMPNSQPLSIDTGLSNARSVPTTPATTPPGNSMPASMQQYPTTQAYDSTRQLYSAPSQPAHEQDTTQDHEQHEYKQEPEYAHSGAQYSSNRGTYPYSATSAAAPLQNEHISPEMTGSPSHPNGSGRATPRTAAAPPQWSGGYSTPQRSNQPPPSSNLYNVMSNDTRSAPNGASATDYANQGGYGASAYQTPNGATPSTKRVRELDDDGADDYARAGNRDAIDGLKRRKTIDEGGAVGPYPPQRIQQRR